MLRYGQATLMEVIGINVMNDGLAGLQVQAGPLEKAENFSRFRSSAIVACQSFLPTFMAL